MKRTFSYTIFIDKPEEIDNEKLFLALKKKVDGSMRYAIEGDGYEGVIFPQYDTFHELRLPILGEFVDARFLYRIGDRIEVTIQKELGLVVGVIEWKFLEINERFVRGVFCEVVGVMD